MIKVVVPDDFSLAVSILFQDVGPYGWQEGTNVYIAKMYERFPKERVDVAIESYHEPLRTPHRLLAGSSI